MEQPEVLMRNPYYDETHKMKKKQPVWACMNENSDRPKYGHLAIDHWWSEQNKKTD